MPKFSYLGPQTSINLPPEKEGDAPESILLIPGAIVDLPKRALETDQVIRYLRRGMLSPQEEPKPKRGRKPATTATTSEGDSE